MTAHARHRTPRRRPSVARWVSTAAVILAAGAFGFVVTSHILAPRAPTGAALQPSPETQTSEPHGFVEPQPEITRIAAPAPARDQVRHTGRVVAASATSLTAVAGNGSTLTFAITPDTTRVRAPGAVSPAGAAFAPVGRDVVVVGVIRDGTPVATAVADLDAVGVAGPPMEYQRDYQLPA